MPPKNQTGDTTETTKDDLTALALDAALDAGVTPMSAAEALPIDEKGIHVPGVYQFPDGTQVHIR